MTSAKTSLDEKARTNIVIRNHMTLGHACLQDSPSVEHIKWLNHQHTYDNDLKRVRGVAADAKSVTAMAI